VALEMPSKASGAAEKSAQQALERHFDLPALRVSDVLTLANAKRLVPGLEPLTDIDNLTDFTIGLGEPAGGAPLDRASAERDVAAVLAVAEGGSLESLEELRAHVDTLQEDPQLLESLKTRNPGLPLVVDERCPLCDKAWNDLGELTAHLEAKRDRSADAARLQTDINRSAAGVARELRPVEKLVTPLIRVAKQLDLAETASKFEEWSPRLVVRTGALSTLDQIRETCAGLVADPSATDAARTFLTIAQERITSLRVSRSQHAKAQAADDAAAAIYDSYCGADGSRGFMLMPVTYSVSEEHWVFSARVRARRVLRAHRQEASTIPAGWDRSDDWGACSCSTRLRSGEHRAGVTRRSPAQSRSRWCEVAPGPDRTRLLRRLPGARDCDRGRSSSARSLHPVD
jgi:hypothetical protein